MSDKKTSTVGSSLTWLRNKYLVFAGLLFYSKYLDQKMKKWFMSSF